MKCTLNCITLSRILWLSAKLLQLCVAQKLLFLKSNAIEISPPSGYTKYGMMRTGNTYPHHTLRTACIDHVVVASFPGLLRLQCLITCSMQKLREKAREFHHMICGTADVTDSRRKSLFTFISTVTEKLKNQNKRPCNHAQ